jgi:hypothetical protein
MATNLTRDGTAVQWLHACLAVGIALKGAGDFIVAVGWPALSEIKCKQIQ